MFYVAIILFISMAIPLAAGYALLKFLFRKNKLHAAFSLALSYGLGMGILTQWMLLLGVFEVKYSLRTVGMPLLFFALFMMLFTFKKAQRESSLPKTNNNLSINKSIKLTTAATIAVNIFYITIGTYILFVFWRALNIPIYTWDPIAASTFKAKVFFFEKSLFSLQNFIHPSYPLHVPLAQTWIALNLGVWNDQLIKIIFPFTFLSFIIIFNYFLDYYTNRKWALLGIFLLFSSNLLILHTSISYRDFFLLYYNCAAIMLLLFWNNKKDDAFLILASFYAGFATFTKLEGTAYLLIHTSLFLLILFHQRLCSFKKNLIQFLKFTIPSFTICFFYYCYKLLAEIPMTEKTQFDFTWSCLSRIPIILKRFSEDIFLSGNWNITWGLLALSLSLNFVKIKKKFEVKVLFLALMMFFTFYFLNALLTENFIWIAGSKSITTLSRLILHFFPLSLLLIVLLNYPEEKSRFNTSSLKPLKQTFKR